MAHLAVIPELLPLLGGPTAILGVFAAGPLIRTVQRWRLRRLCQRLRTLVLTYDDGPGSELTPAVLELLAGAGARATFFPTGRSARANPELLSRVAAAGHEIGCHSDNHFHVWKVSPWRGVGDVGRGYDALAPWVRSDAPFRPPYGKVTLATWWAVRRRRAAVAWWTIDSGDTHAMLPAVESIVQMAQRSHGGIVLMHDFDRSPSARAARHAYVLDVTAALLRLAREERLRICTFGELLRIGGAAAPPGVVANVLPS